MEATTTNTPQDIILRYGILGGLISIIYGILSNLLGLSNPGSGMGMVALGTIISLGIYAGFLVVAVKKHREEDLKGYITFKRAFSVAFFTALIMGIMSSLFQMVYINFIDPSFIDSALEYSRELMENMGLNEEQMEEAMARSRDAYKPVRFLISAVIGTSFIGALTSLVVAGVLNRKAPEGFADNEL